MPCHNLLLFPCPFATTLYYSRMANRKWTDEDRALLVQEYRAGKKYREIAAMLGTTKQCVHSMIRYMREQGVDLPYRNNVGGFDIDALNKL